jgi:hypothetical protein
MTVDMEKLRKLLLVVLSSDQAGEVLSASSAISKLLKKDGKDIHWLVAQIGLPLFAPPLKAAAAPSTKPSWSAHWMEQLAYCYEREQRIVRTKEADFIVSLMGQFHEGASGWQPSLKQRDWLDAIYKKLRLMEDVYGPL